MWQHHRFLDGGGAGGTGRPARRAVTERGHGAQGARRGLGHSRQPTYRDRQAPALERRAATHPHRRGGGRQPGRGPVAESGPGPSAGFAPQRGARPSVAAAVPGTGSGAGVCGGWRRKPGDPARLTCRSQQPAADPGERPAHRPGPDLPGHHRRAARGSTHPLHPPARRLYRPIPPRAARRQQPGQPRNAAAGQAFRRQPVNHPDHR